MVGAGHHDRADDRDGGDGVRERHERGVQQPGHAPDDTEPDKGRQHEHEQHRSEIGHDLRTSPACVTQVSRMIWSSKSRRSLPSWTMWPRNADTFFAYIWLAWSGTVLARFSGPRIDTPSRTISEPGCVSSQLPPVSAARSTTIDPGFIPCTAAAVRRIGAFLPGIAAVVITMSASFAAPARNASSLLCVSSDSSLA